MKRLIIILYLLPSIKADSQDATDTLIDGISIRMDNYDFQYLCLDDALTNPDPSKVYEIYIKQCTKDYTYFPSEIFKFENLKILIIDQYEIKKIPDSIGNLKDLQILVLNFTNIKELPDQIGELTNLVYLDLFDNKLLSLPRSIAKLKNLREIDLGRNHFDRFPEILLEFEGLRSTRWYGNDCNLLPSIEKRRGMFITGCKN